MSDAQKPGSGVPRRTVSRLVWTIGALAIAAVATVALATNPPHDPTELTKGCQDCHVGHSAPNANLNSTDCASCHTTKGLPTWTTGDQANVGVTGTGSSHNWSASATSSSAGAAPPQNAGMLEKITANGGNLSCGACHDPHSQTPTPFDPTAPTTAGSAGRHFNRVANTNNEMCLDCHSAWAQTTADSRSYTGTARSHPVRWQDTAKTVPLTLAVAGTGNDVTYRQTPYDSAIKATAQTGSTAANVVLDANLFKFATGALTGWVVRFTSGGYKNVQVAITGNTQSAVQVAAGALPSAVAAGTTLDIDRVGSMQPYDVTTTMAAAPSGCPGASCAITDTTARTWPTSASGSAASPTSGAGTVTILATTAASKPDVAKVCTISSNTATALTLATGCLTVNPVNGTTWAYRINWKLGGTGATTAAGATPGNNTFVDSTKTWAASSIAGLQVRFPSTGTVHRITAWTAPNATFSPARSTQVAASEQYIVEPAQVGAYTGTASVAGTTTRVTVSAGSWGSANLIGLLIRFTKAGNAANLNVVTKITSNTTTTVDFVALPAAVAANDTFEIDLDGNVTNNVALGGTTSGYTTGTVVCGSCHGVHYADSNAATYDSQPRAGDNHILRRAAGDETCNGCHDAGMHNSVGTGSSKYGAWGTSFNCGTCHQPHGTNNIYLVKQQITTPNSGVKTVDFRDTTGAATYSFAAPSGVTPTTQVCTVCHTQTTRSTNTAAYDWSTHFNGPKCSTCHAHAGGFGAAESRGNSKCHNCHDYGIRVADAGRTSTYHHVMEDSLVTTGTPALTDYPNNATPLTDATTDKTCVQCHVDHNLFRPDINLGVVGVNERGNNIRKTIAAPDPPSMYTPLGVTWNVTPAAGYFTNVDSTVATPTAGVCVSCHASAQTKDQSNQKADGTTGTYAIDASLYGASAHDYAVGGQITNGTNSTFSTNCSKCHSDGQPTGYQSGTYQFALHASVDRRLRAPLGQGAAFQDDLSEAFCYRCHSKVADSIGGDVKKSLDANDWYNTVTNMSNASTDIWTQMQKGTAGNDGIVTEVTTNTLYFMPSSEYAVAEPMPNAHAGTDSFNASSTWIGRAMGPLSPTAAMESYDTAAVSVPTGTTYWRRATFTSAPVKTAGTIPTGTWTINVYDGEDNANANAFARYMIYKWNANDTIGTTIAGRTTFGTEMPIATGGSVVYDFQIDSGTSISGLTTNFPEACGGTTYPSQTNPVVTTMSTTTNTCTNRLYFAGPGTAYAVMLTALTTPTSIAKAISGGSLVVYGRVGVTNQTLDFQIGYVTGGVFTGFGTPVTQAFTTTLTTYTVVLSSQTGTVPAGASLAVRVRKVTASTDPVRFYWSTTYPTLTVTETPQGIVPTLQTIGIASVPAIAVAVGDKIVVDLEIATTATVTGNYAMAYFWGNGAASNVVMPGAATFDYTAVVSPTPASGRHDVARYSGKHKPNPADETRGYIANNQHVECEDCHNPHAAKPGLHLGVPTYTTTTSSTLYLRNTGAINAVPPIEPTAYQYSSGTYTTNTFNQRDMAPTSGATAATTTISTGATALRYDRGLQFVSPQIHQTVTIPSGSTFNLTIREYRATGTSTDYTRLTVYKWDGATATPFNTSAAPGNFGQNATAISTTQTNRTTAFTSNQAVTLNPGDAIVADVEYYHQAGTAALLVSYVYGAFATDAAALALPTGTYVWRTGSTPPVPVFAPVLTGATGVGVTTWGANWAGATTYDPATTTAPLITATAEWQICFKCHSSANANLSAWNPAFTDMALDFNTRNKSYHPVLGALPATNTSATEGSVQIAAARLNNGWTPGSTMTCTDCHNGDAGSPAAQGPHGSAYKFMLSGTNKLWPYQSDGTTLWGIDNFSTGTAPNKLFCLNCHPVSPTNAIHAGLTGQHSGFTAAVKVCVACHILVPHGGKVSRLVITATACGTTWSSAGTTCLPVNVPAPYKLPTGTNFYVISAINKPTSNANITSFQATCNDGHTSGADAW